MFKRLGGLLCVVAMTFCNQAHAQQSRFAPFFADRAASGLVVLHGVISSRASLHFDKLLEAYPNVTTVLLSSPGGDVHAALQIARAINRHGITTIIPNGFGCFSACAFLLLAGRERVIDGELGVHQISSRDPDIATGQIAIADILETLTQFGVDIEVITLMLRTRAQEVYVFSEAEIRKYGISTSSSKTFSVEDPTGTGEWEGIEKGAVAFLERYLSIWSDDGVIVPPDFSNMYGEIVTYYGKTVGRREVLQDKQRFVKRWPMRSYNVDKNSIWVRCEDGVNCRLDFHNVWRTESKERHAVARGRAAVSVGLRYDGATYRIVAESSKVVRRD